MLHEPLPVSERLSEHSGFTVLRADDDELKELVYRFRYHVYVELMARRQIHADHRRRTICEPLDENGVNYLAVRDGRIIGTIRRNLLSDASTAYYAKVYKTHLFEAAEPRTISTTTKLMMLPQFQKTTYPVRLIRHYAADGYRDGLCLDLIDCNRHLIPFFEKMGYFSYIGWIFHKEFGTVRPMFLSTDAVDYLRLIGSFLLEAGAPYVSDNCFGGYRHIARLAEPPGCGDIRDLSAPLRSRIS